MLLSLGMFGSALFAFVWLTLLALAPFDVGAYSLGGQAVTGPEFLRVMGIPLGACALLCAVISYGLWKERPWTRGLMIVFWTILDAFLVAEAMAHPSLEMGVAGTVLFALVYLAAAAWYLYGKVNVASYYRALEQEQAARERDTP